MHELWFWQRIVTPHMTGLAIALARLGAKVTYVAERQMSSARSQQGWQPTSELGGVQLHLARSRDAMQALATGAPADATHICQGVRANGLIGHVQRVLSERGARQWVVMETVDDAGPRGVVKRLVYRLHFVSKRRALQGVLATGHRTPDWVADQGFPRDSIYPFAYFLPSSHQPSLPPRQPGPYRFLYVGQLIPRKRVSLLLAALQQLNHHDFELLIVGGGPLEAELRARASSAPPGRVQWLGVRPQGEVSEIMAQADCLVLPSRHDGWGAVVSEALMVGTPAICSDACGAAGVVRASGFGGVFRTHRQATLTRECERQLIRGPVTAMERPALSAWADALGAEAGAKYLLEILAVARTNKAPREPPWRRSRPATNFAHP